jgi:hypothetical protein
VKLKIPKVFAIDEKTARKNPIQQLAENSRRVEGILRRLPEAPSKGFCLNQVREQERYL